MRRIWKISLIVMLVLSTPLASFAAEVPQNGHDWQSMPESERVGYCSLLIFGIVGVGNPLYSSEQIYLAANFFAGRINYYYKNHSPNISINEAVTWSWPEAKKFLDGL